MDLRIKIECLLCLWAGAALLFWVLFLLSGHYNPMAGYYTVMLVLIGVPILRYKNRVRSWIVGWELSPKVKFLLLGYGMVLLEEVFASLFNDISGGFSVAGFLRYVPQFWAFNILAFTGLIIGMLITTSVWKYSYRETFYLAGIFGLFSEHAFSLVLTNPIQFLLLAPLEILVYGIIMTPALLCLSDSGRRSLRPALLKYAITLVVIFIIAVPPVLVLSSLRTVYPSLFPPTKFIR